MGATLRPHQVHIVEQINRAIAGGDRRVMAQAPTGFGKTITAAEIINEARSRGWRIIFVVPALSLIEQTVERFYAEGIRDVGVIQANHHLTNYARPVLISLSSTKPTCSLRSSRNGSPAAIWRTFL
jgi:DNA repair protein RadD